MENTASYPDIFRQITHAAKDLIRHEVRLVKVEAQDVVSDLGNHLARVVLYAVLMILSGVPLLASAVIALGDYWEGNYALSALVVGLAAAAISGALVYHSLRKMSEHDFTMSATQAKLNEGAQVVGNKAEGIKDAVTGDAQ